MLIYGNKYGEFYARMIWAQKLSFVLFSISILFVVAGIVDESMRTMYALGGVVVPTLFGYYFYNHTS